MEFVQRGGEGSNPKSQLFAIHFGSIEIKFWGQSRAIDTYFWIQTLNYVLILVISILDLKSNYYFIIS